MVFIKRENLTSMVRTPGKQSCFDLVIIGHLAFEKIKTPLGQKTVLGGAGHYGIIPASLFSKKVGLVSRVGGDYNLGFLKKLKVDFSGVKKLPNQKTARFSLDYKDENDFSVRQVGLKFNACTLLSPKDIPSSYLKSRFIHIATNTPQNQLEFIKFLREKTKAKLSIDTIEDFIEQWPDLVYKAFSGVDIIFINQREKDLLAKLTELKNKVIVLKKGPEGAEYISGSQDISVKAPKIENVVDTTGSGDVLASVFLICLAKRKSIKEALQIAVNTASESIKYFGVEGLLNNVKRQ